MSPLEKQRVQLGLEQERLRAAGDLLARVTRQVRGEDGGPGRS